MKFDRSRVTAVTFMTFAMALSGCGGGGGSEAGATAPGDDAPSGGVTQQTPSPGLGQTTLPPNISPNPVPVPTPSAPAAPVPAPTGGSVPSRGSPVTGAWSPTILPWSDSPGATVGKVLPLHAALLADGRVLSYGQNTLGKHEFLYDIWQPPKGDFNGAEDPSRHTVLPTGITTHLFCSSQILIPSTGQLLISGGDIWNDLNGAQPETTGASNKGNNEANLFTPGPLSGASRGGTMARNAAGGMYEGRWYATPTTLPNGEMYIQGGTDGTAVYGGGIPVTATRAEIRNPVTGAFRVLTGFSTVDLQNNYPRNWIAPDGRIFGWDHQQMYRIDWRGIGSRTTLADTGIPWHNGWATTSTSVMFRPGRILQVGGVEADVVNDPLASKDGLQTHIVDINAWTPGSALSTAPPAITRGPDISQRRQWANATVLPDGKVVLMGGSERNVLEDPANNYANRGKDSLFVEIFDPDADGGRGSWTVGPSQKRFRLYHSIALLLPNGTVLSAAGGWPGPRDFFDGEIYYPPYLFDADGNLATRPALAGVREAGKPLLGSDVPHPVDATKWLELETPDAEDIRRITIVKTGSVTHSFNFEQRFLELGNVDDGDKPILREGSRLRVKLPANPYETPPGYYMAFAINSKGVPSEARIFLVNPVN